MFEFLFFLIGFIVFALLAVCMFASIQGIIEWSQNNKAPILTEDAIILAKYEDIYFYPQIIGDLTVPTMTTDYYITFQLVGGVQLKFSVPADVYHELDEGLAGSITYQGTRFKSFIPNQD